MRREVMFGKRGLAALLRTESPSSEACQNNAGYGTFMERSDLVSSSCQMRITRSTNKNCKVYNY